MAGKETNLFNNSKGSIDQIREIIFGDQIIEFDKQIKELKKECSNLKNRINAVEKKNTDIDQVMTENLEKQKTTASDQQRIQEIIDQLKKEFDRKIAELIDTKVDKSQIGQAFIEWGMKVKQTTDK